MGKLSTVQECVFDANIVLSGVIENLLSVIAKVDGFEEITKLPLSEIPVHVRRNDPNLKFQAMYEIRSKHVTQYKILLGENTIGIALNKQGEYTSWTNSLFPEIKKIFTEVIQSGRISIIDRIGLRYIDFIENYNIFDKGKVSIQIDGHDAQNKKMFVRVEGEEAGMSYFKNISNNSSYMNFQNSGSVVDIITAINYKDFTVDKINLDTFFNNVDSLHNVHVNKFKEIIDDELIKQYEI